MARILIIDDDEFFRVMLTDMLGAMGHEVTEAREGGEGLRKHASGGFDLVMTDLIMPGVEGVETIIELRKREPRLRILAMSGGGRSFAEDYLHIASKVGADIVLAKPFTREELEQSLAAVMEGSGPAGAS